MSYEMSSETSNNILIHVLVGTKFEWNRQQLDKFIECQDLVIWFSFQTERLSWKINDIPYPQFPIAQNMFE